MPVAVVDMDHSGTSRALESRLAALQQAEVAARPPSPAAALDQLRERRVSAIVVIPEGFERRILSGGQGVVVLYGNGAYLLRTSTALAGVGAALGTAGRAAAVDQAMALGAPAPPALAMIQRPLFNTREGYGATIFPGVAFLIIQQTLLMGLAMLAATMRERQGALSFSGRGLLGIALGLQVDQAQARLQHLGACAEHGAQVALGGPVVAQSKLRSPLRQLQPGGLEALDLAVQGLQFGRACVKLLQMPPGHVFLLSFEALQRALLDLDHRRLASILLP